MADEPSDEHFHGQQEKTPKFEMAIPRIALVATVALLAFTSERTSFRSRMSTIIADADGAAQNLVAYPPRNLR
ncbi:MAG: hypothetical protein WA049_10215 [Ferribacterium limneticum]